MRRDACDLRGSELRKHLLRPGIGRRWQHRIHVCHCITSNSSPPFDGRVSELTSTVNSAERSELRGCEEIDLSDVVSLC
jgi:hypothetical protein